MKILLNMAISPNGYIAREDGTEDWLPSEGWNEFLELAKTLDNVVMGRKTYEIVTAQYREYNFNDVSCDYKVIVTHNEQFKAPEGYTVVHSPEEAVEFLESMGIEVLFLIGGGELNVEFIKRKLVNEIHLIINPYIIGKGRSFIHPDDFDLPLKLVSHEELSKGRVKLVYEVEQF